MATNTLVRSAALCLSASAAFAAEDSPPRALGSPASAVDNCYRLHGRTGEVAGEAKVAVSVDAEGRVTAAASEPGTRPALAAAAECVAVTMRFEPATKNGRAVAGSGTVDIGFPTKPEMRHDLRRAIEYCQPAMQPLVTLNAAYEGTLELLLKVGKDGRVTETVLPEGVLPWMEEAARCLADRLEFFPARLGLEPVESWTAVHVDFNLSRNPHERVRLDAPTIRSGDAEILAAYRGCYPAGRTDEARINYRITVTEGGRVRKAEVVGSSGDTALDEAGVCILRRLLFVPARRNGQSVESTISWPILVRPPG
jgi:TonB family protein